MAVSYLEIYNEILNDLIKTENTHLKLYENEKEGIIVKGLSEIVCTSYDEVKSLLISGETNKHIGATALNEKSTRAHIMYKITIMK